MEDVGLDTSMPCLLGMGKPGNGNQRRKPTKRAVPAVPNDYRFLLSQVLKCGPSGSRGT